jgi:hypothetical protein
MERKMQEGMPSIEVEARTTEEGSIGKLWTREARSARRGEVTSFGRSFPNSHLARGGREGERERGKDDSSDGWMIGWMIVGCFPNQGASFVGRVLMK